VQGCLKPLDRRIRWYPRIYDSSLLSVGPPLLRCLAFRGLTNDRERILRSVDRGGQRSGDGGCGGAMGIFRHKSARLKVLGSSNYGRSLCV